MQKGTLTKWGQAMTNLGLLACGAFSGLTVTAYATVLAVINAPSISQTFPDEPLQIIWLFVKGGFLVAVAVVILAGIFKAVTYGIGLALVKLDDFLYGDKPANIRLTGKIVKLGERSELYIQVKNSSFSGVEDVRVSLLRQSKLNDGNYVAFGSFIKWGGSDANKPSVSIRGLRSKLLHFATIDEKNYLFVHTQSGSILLNAEPDGHIFPLTVYVTIQKTSKQKSKDFDIVVTYNEDSHSYLKIKKVKKGEKRQFFEG